MADSELTFSASSPGPVPSSGPVLVLSRPTVPFKIVQPRTVQFLQCDLHYTFPLAKIQRSHPTQTFLIFTPTFF
jgi:hypothetical protein